MVRALLCLKIGYMNVFLLNEMDPDEVEFFGEKSQISIVPSFNSATIHLISGDVGPFRAGIPTTVPLWLAVNLKRQQQCKIQSPDWMRLEELERIKNDEKESRTFTSMPENYIVEAKLILGCASDDIPKADEVRTMIKDIWDIRTSKLRSSVDSLIKKTTMYAAVDNITIMEINSIRPILPHALDQIYRIINSKKGVERRTQGTTLSHSRTAGSFSS